MRKLKYLFLISVFFILFSTHVALAFDSGVINVQNPIDNMQVKIPGVKASTVVCTDEGKTCAIPWLSDYIVGVFKYSLGIAGILTTIIMMWGGFRWLISAGNSQAISDAKKWIGDSVIGLVILFSSYLILYQVNPELVKLKPLNISIIQKMEAPMVEGGSESTASLPTTGTAAQESELKSISSLVTTSASDPRLKSTTYVALEKAVEEAKKEGLAFTVTSAHRTMEYQQQLYDQAVKDYGADASKYVAKPSATSPHVQGVAVDICITGTASCGKMGGKEFATYSDADVKKLQTIMAAAGWKRYCGEWWHFQPASNPPKDSCSP